MPLPPLPRIELRQLEDLSPGGDEGGYLRVRRLRLRTARPGEPASEPFVYDTVERKALDAVVITAHFSKDGKTWVYLRSAIRPPVYLRPLGQRPLAEKESLGVLWELPAGLVEDDETSPEGLLACAARELEEELGFSVAPERFQTLGPSTFPSGGVIGERQHYVRVEVDPARRGRPSEDGSVLERAALIEAVALEEALTHCRDGVIEDSKTEIALRRLAES